MRIRPATQADVPAMTDTLNWAIRETAVIFRKEEASVEERSAYVAQLREQGYPVLIAESDEGAYLGWALLHPYRDPNRWTGCFEDSIYIDPAAHGRGVGTALLQELISCARADERIHSVLALITSENEPSLALHQKLGFELRGTFREVAFKFERWLDLHHLQLMV